MAYASAERKMRMGTGFGNRSSYQAEQSTSSGRGQTNSMIQAKLSVGASDTPAEQEADRVSKQIMGGVSRLHEQDAALNSQMGSSSGEIQREVMVGANGEGFMADSGLAASMDASAGHSLDASASAQIGRQLGADFSGVRVHTDHHAQQVATGMSARAFTRGKDIYFNRGQYNPGTAAGKELLAHELTHTIQQGQVSQKGGIAVRQSATPQTAQRGFFSFRKHYRQAVDERNNYYEDYKKQSKWDRLKWALKNPLAFTFGRTESNKAKTKERTARREMVANLDLDALLDSTAQNEGVAGTGGNTETIAEIAQTLETQNKGLGEKNQRERFANTAKKMGGAALGTLIPGVALGAGSAVPRMINTWADAKGMGESVEELADKIGWDGLSDLNENVSEAFDGIGDGVLNGIGGSMGIVGGGLNVVSNILDMSVAINDAEYLSNNGDIRAGVARGFDAAANGAGILKGLNTMIGGIGTLAGAGVAMAPGVSAVTGGLNVIAGGAKAFAGGIDASRARNVKKSTEESQEYYGSRLKHVQNRLKNKDLTDEQREKLQQYEKQLQLQMGFMRMGHNTASVDQTRGTWKVVDGVMNSIGGAMAALGPACGALGIGGIGIGLAGTALGLGGKIYADAEDTKLKRKEVDLSLDMKKRIDNIMEKAKQYDAAQTDESKKLKLTEREAKHMVLRQDGYVSRSEAYLKLAKDRKEAMDSMLKIDKDSMVRSLGLDPEKASEQLIYQRLGLDAKQAANVDRGILKQQKKRKLPSWRR